MASTSSVLCKNTTNKIFHSKYLVGNKMTVMQAFGICKKMKTAEICTHVNVLAGWPYIVTTKRNLCWATVAQLADNGKTDMFSRVEANFTFRPYEQSLQQHYCENSCVENSGIVFSVHSKDNLFTSMSIGALPHGKTNVEYDRHSQHGMKSLSHSGHSCCQDRLNLTSSKRLNLTSSKHLHQSQSVRHFSRRRRHVDRSDEDEDDEEKKRRLRGAVMYVTNPLTWISKQWNIVKLKHSLDPGFSENEFQHGAKQAVSHVLQMVSVGSFDQLSGLVVDEVIDWLTSFRNSLAAAEREALALTVSDVVLVKIRYLHQDMEEDKPVAFVDCVCFGLRMCHRLPFFVDMGIRFRRDYSTDPPGDWVVAGVSHIRLQNLATD